MVFPDGASWNMKLLLVRTFKEQTQQEMADEIGTARKVVWKWEKGKSIPDSYSRRRLANWAGVPEGELFAGINDTKGNCQQKH